MTPDNWLAEIEAYCEAATPGDWQSTGGHPCFVSLYEEYDDTKKDENLDIQILNKNSENDGNFIARSRTDFPKLLAYCKRLRVALEEIKEQAHHSGHIHFIARQALEVEPE